MNQEISEARPENRLQKSIRIALRWVLVALTAFVLGALLITAALYIPARLKLDKASASLGSANAEITGITDQIVMLQTDHEAIQNNLDTTTLHLYVLKALSGVRGASLAVAADDYAGARLSLIQTSEALDNLTGLLGTDQKDVLTAMQKSAAQALSVIKTDIKSAQPELGQLTKNLLQLEANLFPNL